MSQNELFTKKFLPYRRRDRIVVSTLRCGRNNPGSNPGHGNVFFFLFNCLVHFPSVLAFGLTEWFFNLYCSVNNLKIKRVEILKH